MSAIPYLKEELKRIALDLGFDLAGVAGVADTQRGRNGARQDLVSGLAARRSDQNRNRDDGEGGSIGPDRHRRALLHEARTEGDVQ